MEENIFDHRFQIASPESVGISSKKVLKFIKTLDKYHFCTHSILMARGNRIFTEAYYAPFEAAFKHRMYSVSKSFVSIAVGLAVEDGLLSLDDKMMNFFPEYADKVQDRFLGEMTIRDMLTMETCKDKKTYWFETGTKDRCEVFFCENADRISGTTWSYDSPGSFMLNVIVEKLVGKPFLEYIKERFLVKAGFSEDAYCLQCPGGYSFGDSGVMCTARDLLVFARFIMDGGKIDGVQYMDEDYLIQATKKQASNGKDGAVGYGTYGYGYQIWKAPNDGFAFVGMGDQFAICDREKDFVFVINSDNQGHSPSTRAILYHALYELIVENLGDPLDENVQNHNELKEYICNLKLFSLNESVSSPCTDKINGKAYRLDKNPMGIEYVRFDLEKDRGILTYKNAQGVKKLPFGFGHNVFGEFPQEDYSDLIATVPKPGNRYRCAVSADWPDEKTLRIKVQIIDKYFGNMSMVFGFKGNEVGIAMVKNAEAFLEEYQGYANGVCFSGDIAG